MISKFDYAIIADFLSPSMKERIIYELSSHKKRHKALERFSHSVETILRTEYIYYKGNVIPNAVKNEIKKSVSKCTVLSLEFDQGKNMPISEAFDYLIDKSFFAIIIIDNWLIIKPEYEKGQGLFYIMRKR